MEGFSDGSSTLPASTKKKDMTAGHVLLFGFRRPKGGSTLRHFNARGQQSRPRAILRRLRRLLVSKPLVVRFLGPPGLL